MQEFQLISVTILQFLVQHYSLPIFCKGFSYDFAYEAGILFDSCTKKAKKTWLFGDPNSVDAAKFWSGSLKIVVIYYIPSRECSGVENAYRIHVTRSGGRNSFISHKTVCLSLCLSGFFEKVTQRTASFEKLPHHLDSCLSSRLPCFLFILLFT